MFTLEDMRRFFIPIKHMIYGVVGRAILTAVNNSTKTQVIQVQMFGDEVFEMERLQEYGLENYPDPTDENNEVVFVAIGGNRGLALAIRIHNRELRPKTLVAGEVMLYSQFGQKIYLKADGSIDISAPGKDVKISACANLVVTADTKVTLTAPAVELSDGTQRKLADERIVTAINALTFGGHAIDAPLVLANVTTAKTKAG